MPWPQREPRGLGMSSAVLSIGTSHGFFVHRLEKQVDASHNSRPSAEVQQQFPRMQETCLNPLSGEKSSY